VLPVKTAAQKLLIAADSRLWLSDPGRTALLDPLPEGVQVVGSPRMRTWR
jgi:hypothetical protein